MMITKIKILSQCPNCQGEKYLPAGMDVDYKGEKYQRYLPCPQCHGSGLSGKWINLFEFQQLLAQVECPHEHVVSSGGLHISEAGLVDSIKLTCSDCEKSLD